MGDSLQTLMPPLPPQATTLLSDDRIQRPSHLDDNYFSHADLFSGFQRPTIHSDNLHLPSLVPPSTKSYAAAVADTISTVIPCPLRNSIPGSYQAVKINSELYQKRLALCQFSLIGRIVLSKGDTPWSLTNLKDKLSSIWRLQASWRLISLGRGFYHILLNSD